MKKLTIFTLSSLIATPFWILFNSFKSKDRTVKVKDHIDIRHTEDYNHVCEHSVLDQEQLGWLNDIAIEWSESYLLVTIADNVSHDNCKILNDYDLLIDELNNTVDLKPASIKDNLFNITN